MNQLTRSSQLVEVTHHAEQETTHPARGSFRCSFGFLTITTPLVAANKEKVLYSFCAASGCADEQLPSGGLVFDAAGHLYGTTVYGGANGGAGTVLQLAPGANGTWTETVLYNFCSARQCTDGWSPYAGVIVDAVGNLYGTTYNGGAYGFGTVFQLAPGANGTWTEKVLYNFCAAQHCADGKAPSASLIFDAAGNLYGTTFFGGSAYDLGTVFQLAPGTNGRWTEKVLHRFGNGKDDGYWPDGSLIFDSAGTLYGITRQGGAHVYYGTVFQLVRGTNGKWSEKVLHSFNYDGKDGYYPGGSLVVDAAGNLYGTTPFGGPNGSGCDKYGCGTIFKLAPGTRGKWAETILHSFNDNFSGGHYPYAGLCPSTRPGTCMARAMRAG